MTTYSISEAAERTGFSASALRYYEGIGLAAPTKRTDAGYRRYDERALARLAFVARAKQLGCTLEEITDLVAVWDDDECGPVQQRLHDLVTTKIAEADRQIGELDAFRRDLRATAAQLESPVADASCGDGCACTRQAPQTAVACTLDDADRPERVRTWRRVAQAATARTRQPHGGWRLELGPSHEPVVALADLAALIAAEQQCCTFFTFTLTVDANGVALDVRTPPDAQQLADALLGTGEG